jgi:hypothetical protein
MRFFISLYLCRGACCHCRQLTLILPLKRKAMLFSIAVISKQPGGIKQAGCAVTGSYKYL